MLETIRDLMNTSCIVPDWLHDIFLGYDDPGAAHYTRYGSQEKFQDPHFGFKKGNNWDFKGISLGKPKIGKVLPKPSMGF